MNVINEKTASIINTHINKERTIQYVYHVPCEISIGFSKNQVLQKRHFYSIEK